MRSTSGITCCHFFCSAVFSMPVWRKPMVAFAVTIVSPESSSTRRSTPCVLGCCGPILTVMVSLRSSGIWVAHGLWLMAHGSWLMADGSQRALYDLAHDVDQRAVHFLHARRILVRHVHVDVRRAAHASAVPSRQRNRLQPLRPG